MSKGHTFIKSLSVAAFAVLGLSLANAAFAGPYSTFQKTVSPFNKACSLKTASFPGWALRVLGKCDTTTVGGAITYIEHHHKAIKCTWANYEGVWSAEPGVPGDPTKPMVVTQQVGGPGNETRYAICSGWSDGKEDNPATVPSPFTEASHDSAPYGKGYFWYRIDYRTTAAIDCEDPGNAGIGNNCGTFTDAQNKKHSLTLTGVGDRECKATATGTELTYRFACGSGVAVRGELKLVPTINEAPQSNPVGDFGSFTNCNSERIAAGECTMQYGGFPMKLVKQGKTYVEVVDLTACTSSTGPFPGVASVPNALDSGQSQPLAAGQVLVYTEVANGTKCDPTTGLPIFDPTESDITPPESYAKGTPTAAYGRFCQSDVDLFSNNLNEGGTIFGTEATSTLEGFDNVWRKCPVAAGHYHTGAQDVEKVRYGGGTVISVQANTNTNLMCNNESTEQTNEGTFTVYIPNQITQDLKLDNRDIDITPLADAPKIYGKPDGLIGAAPYEANPNVLLADGVTMALQLKYKRCQAFADAVREGGWYLDPTATLYIKGETTNTGLLGVGFTGQFDVNIKW